MEKRTVRIWLVFTLFIPYWIFVCLVLCLFPGFLALMGGFTQIIWCSVKLIATDEDREDIYSDMQDALIIMFIPITFIYFEAGKFIETGKLLN